jgi:hypothetical protein
MLSVYFVVLSSIVFTALIPNCICICVPGVYKRGWLQGPGQWCSKGVFPPCFQGSISGLYCSSVAMGRQSGSHRGPDEGSAEGKTVRRLLKEGHITKEVNEAG